MSKTSLWIAIACACVASFTEVSVAEASSFDRSLSTGEVRVTTPASIPSTCTAVLMGVGTAMTNYDYDTIANAIVAYGYVVVVMDDNPGSLTKNDANKFRNVTLSVKSSLASWVAPGCANGFSRWIIGGHSASGQAAHEAIVADPGLADALFSLDPYDIGGLGNTAKPGLYWGFSGTTCFVSVDGAAKAAYLHSTGHRVFHRTSINMGWEWCGYIPHYAHCSFTNGGCPGCANCVSTPSSFYSEVAQSLNKFVNALASGNWAKSYLTLSNPQTPVTTFVDGDSP